MHIYLIFLFLELFFRYSQVIQRYFAQYLSGFDVAVLKEIIQVSWDVSFPNFIINSEIYIFLIYVFIILSKFNTFYMIYLFVYEHYFFIYIFIWLNYVIFYI